MLRRRLQAETEKAGLGAGGIEGLPMHELMIAGSFLAMLVVPCVAAMKVGPVEEETK